MAGAELLRLLREPLGNGVGHPRGDVGARSGQRADRRADGAAAQELPRVALGEAPHAVQHVADLGLGHLPGFIDAPDAAQNLRHGEHPDHDRDQREATGELGTAEGEARESRRVVEALRCDQQPEQQRHHPFQRIADREEHGAGQSKHDEPEIFEGRKFERNLGEARRRRDQHRGAE